MILVWDNETNPVLHKMTCSIALSPVVMGEELKLRKTTVTPCSANDPSLYEHMMLGDPVVTKKSVAIYPSTAGKVSH